MNVNAKNLIRLRALSPESSVNVKVENMNVIEREKSHIQSRVRRYRENKKGGWKPTHIIELQGRVICVYGLESNNKTEYAVTCGSEDDARKLWDELFSEHVIEYHKVDKVSTKPDNKSEIITPYEFIDLIELNDKLNSLSEEYTIVVNKLKDKIMFATEILVNLNSYPIEISDIKYTSILSIMKNGVIRLTIKDDIYLCSEFNDNLDGAKSFIESRISNNYISIEKLKGLLTGRLY